MTDILEIEGIIRPFWEKNLETILLAMAGLLALTLLLFLYRLIRKKREGKKVPPAEEALTRLKELEQSDWVKKGDYRKFYFALSDILKTYLERRYGFPATDLTTEELKNRAHAPDMVPFLERADLVKFADRIPAENEPAEDVSWLVSFIKRTREPSK